MAEYGAHITITAKDRPSIFDVVAQDGLMSTLQPAVKHIMKVIAESNPEKHGWCLKYSGASFAENFYDLKRVQLKANGSIKPLTLSNETYTKSLLALGAFPYLRSQMDSVYQDIQEKDADGRLSEEGWKVKIQKVVLKVWPLLHLSWELLTLIYYIRYLIGRSRFHSPLLLLTGVRLANLDKEDYEIIDARAEQLLSFTNVRSLQDLGQWLMEQTAGIQSISGLKTEDCPICFKTRKQDTVLSVSGYVFCYSCILPYVRRENKCPVTGYPASTTQVIRIYQEI
ncbi:Peroxisome assembly protein 12-like [Homarus americanus]|uniref:Peroxisome assembly protein 12 n=1 Tax=Homarus americanus TaxID=6706 RepID=A0A8J5N1V8_HOMAM|nr:Peroxisome assembly protein 12-like [Homarus americanus]